MALADLLVRIGVDTAAFSSGLEKFNSEIGKSAREAEKKFGNIAKLGDGLQGLGVGLTAALALPIAGFATAATAAFAEIDSLKRGLFTLEKSAQGTERRFRELQEVAKLPGLGLEEAVRGDIRLRAIGLSSETSKRALLAFGNALASVGSGKADLDETIRQFGQLATASSLTAENLKPIIERVPQAAQILRTAFGTANAEQLRDLGVTSAQVVNVLISELEKLPPVTGGIKNALENFSDSTKIALASAGEAIAPFVESVLTGFSSVITKIPELARAFSALPDPAKAAGLAIASAAFVGPLAVVAIGTVISNLSAIATAFNVVKTSAAFAAVVSALGAAIASVGSVAGVTAAAMGALSLALGPGAWLALAAAVGVAGNEILKYREAVNLSKSLEDQQARGQAVLIISLRQAGVAVDELIRQKNAGIITEKQYQQAIRDAAIALGNQRRAAAEAASGVTSVASANDLAKQKFLELGKQVEAGKISADAFFAAFQKASGLDKAKLSAEEFKLKVGELDAKLAANKITAVEYALSVDALRQSHAKAALSVEAHNAAYSGFKRVTQESQILIAQQNILLSEQRKNIEDVAAARLKLSRGQVAIDFGDIPQIETKIKISEIDIPSFDELNDLNGTISSIDDNDRITKAQQDERNRRSEASIKRLGAAYKAAGTVGKRAMQEVSTVLTNLSQGIGQAIFSGEKFGAVFLRIGKQIGASITSFIIQELLRASGILEGFSRTLSGVIRNLAGGAAGGALGSAGASIGGSIAGSAVGSAAGGVFNAAGSAGGAAASTAGQVAGAAASAGVTAIVGAVSGVVSAISGVFGNFQMAAMNKTLDLIEGQTRKTANDLANLRSDEFVRKDEYFTKLDSLFTFTWVKLDELITSVRSIGSIPVNAAVAGGGSVNNFALSAFVAPGGEAQFFDWFAAELRRRRLIP